MYLCVIICILCDYYLHTLIVVSQLPNTLIYERYRLSPDCLRLPLAYLTCSMLLRQDRFIFRISAATRCMVSFSAFIIWLELDDWISQSSENML